MIVTDDESRFFNMKGALRDRNHQQLQAQDYGGKQH